LLAQLLGGRRCVRRVRVAGALRLLRHRGAAHRGVRLDGRRDLGRGLGHGLGHVLDHLRVGDAGDGHEAAGAARNVGAVGHARSYAKPRRLASRSIPAMTVAMWASISTPSSSAPRAMSSRLTAAANRLSFSFFFTDFGVIPASPSGRTWATAVTKPASSSTAKSVFAMRLSRGTPE